MNEKWFQLNIFQREGPFNENFKRVTSINIKNKFYLNFNEFQNVDQSMVYTVTMLIKRRTNNKHNELHNMIKNFIEQIQSVVSLQ